MLYLHDDPVFIICESNSEYADLITRLQWTTVAVINISVERKIQMFT
jgi:hypothetical protein